MALHTWRYGLVGCGRFGVWCLDLLSREPRVEPVAVADMVSASAEAAANARGLACCDTPEELIRRRDVELVHIATPPATHYELAMIAVRAGKHVLCEKPLALNACQADEVLAAARERKVHLAVNHVLRYSPLLKVVKAIVRSGVLGRPLHAIFENYAEDERLPATHWFWDAALSGGIFIEHGVHFFDLYRWWFGSGTITAAGIEPRPGSGQVDRAWCTIRYEGGVLVHHYHGFDQPLRLDRSDHRILFERGDVRVVGWVPMALHVHGLVNDGGRERLVEMCPQAKLTVLDTYHGPSRHCRGRGNEYQVAARIELGRVLTEERGSVYAGLVRSLLLDQLDALDQPGHTPRLAATDAREAVAVAETATRIAQARPAERD